MANVIGSKKHLSGLSLIELMIAMLIGLILIGGTISIYLASKRSYVDVTRMATMNQNSRFALQMISETLIHAGFTGELPIGNIKQDTNLNPIAGVDCSDTAAAYNIDNYLIAEMSDSAGHAFGCITDAVPDTAVLLVKNVRPMQLRDSNGNGTIDSPEKLNSKNTYIMTNNIRGLIFDGADPPPSINAGGEVPNGHAWIYECQIYYIRDIGTGVPQLSRKVLKWNGMAMAFTTEDLVESVENMSFLFGNDTDADGEIDSYKTLDLVNDWNKVASVEVNILIRSDTFDPLYRDSKTYNLVGLKPIGPLGDHYHRMLMQNTVSLRNPKFVIRGSL